MEKLIAATYAPMDSTGDLNTSIIPEYSAFLKANQIRGAFVNGSTGDFVSLSTAERKKLIEAWSLNKQDDFYLINHVGHTNLREAMELAAHSNGRVDAIAALAPYYFRPHKIEDLLKFCVEIAHSAPDTLFYYYHIPVLTGVDFPMEDFLQMAASQIPNFGGIKYTEDNLPGYSRTLKHSNVNYNIYFGVDEKLLDSLSVGAKGWVGSTYNHLAPLYRQIIELHENGDLERASLLQAKSVLFVETLNAVGGFHGGSKSFMQLFGLPMGPSRFPHQTMSLPLLTTAVQRLEKQGILPFLSTPFSKNLLADVV